MKNNLITFLLIVVVLTSCKSTALVTCNNIEKFESRAGVINTSFFNIGDVLILDTLHKTGSYLLHIDVDSFNLTQTNPIDTFEIISKTDFTISLSGKIVNDNNASIAAKNSINNSSSFYLMNSYRKGMKEPMLIINDSILKFKLIKALIKSKNCILMLVSSMVFAKEIKLKLSRSVLSGVNANIIKVGEFTLRVNYNCNDALTEIAKTPNGTGVFYKCTFVELNQMQTDLSLITKAPNLAEYNMVQGFKQ